jgi:release factor glutamine methyltransferase
MESSVDVASLTRALAGAGCVAADEEAEEIARRAHGQADAARMLARRLTGEPLEWITGRAHFCGLDLAIEPGVYVPRWQSEPLALKAAQLLPATGQAVDVCTGAGAVALVLQTRRPGARVVATDTDPVAVRCARANGITVHQGDLDEPLPPALAGGVDVMTGVPPYVPHDALHLLPRDVQRFEPRKALDGGARGLEVLTTLVGRSPRWVRPGGWLLLEIGGDQVAAMTALMTAAGYRAIDVLVDEEGDPRGIRGRFEGS